MVSAGSPAAILARQQKLVGTARRQLHMSRFTTPVPAQLGACKPEPRSGVQVLSTADYQQSQPQQHPLQKRTEPAMLEEDSQHADHSDCGEIFPAAASEGAEEAAAGGKLSDADSDTGIYSTTVTDHIQQAAAADDPATLSPSAQRATPGADAAAFQEPDADCAVTSGSDDQLGADQSVSTIIQRAAASVADASDVKVPAALLLCEQDKICSDARAEVSALQGAWHVLTNGNDTQEQYGKEYPWMQLAEQAAASNANIEQSARSGAEGSTQQVHVTFASGGMTCGGGSKIPMRILAAAAADKRLAAEEAAAAAAAGRRSVAKAAAAAEAAAGSAAGTAEQDVVVTQAGNADLGEHIRQAAEQDVSQSSALSEHVQTPAMLPLPGSSSTLPFSQPPADKLNEPEISNHSLEKAVLDHAQGGVEVIEEGSDGTGQCDAVSVASFANSAASGLGHLLRAQQPWSESSSSPDQGSTSSSAGMHDVSQLEAEVLSQPDTDDPLPQQLSSDQEAEAVGGQLLMQLMSAQEQPQQAYHGVVQHQEAKLVMEEGEDQQQKKWHSAGQGESQHGGGLNLPLAAGCTDASRSLDGHASGKQTTKSLRVSSIGENMDAPFYVQIALHATSLWSWTVFVVLHVQLAGTASWQSHLTSWSLYLECQKISDGQ